MPSQAPNVRPRRTAWRYIWEHNVVFIFACCAVIYWLLSTTTDQAPQGSPAPSVSVNCDPNEPSRKVAIIGAGSAGSSAAYYINKFKGPCSKVNVTVYERSDYVGGRSTTVDVYGDPSEPVEVGASIFVQVNRNLVSAVNEFELSTQGYNAGAKGKLQRTLGIYNGEEWVFRGNDGGWWDIAKLLWKYGMAPIKTQRLMKKTVGLFLKMYEGPAFPFRDLSQVVYDLGLTEATAMTGEQYLSQNGIDISHGSFATDIIQASTRVNYAQDLGQIHGLETMVCMATDGAMQVQGGNWQIFSNMLKASGATVQLNTSVSSLQRQPNGTYALNALSSTSPLPSTTYDTIILATPLQFANLTLSPEPLNPPPSIPYVNLHVTLFTSPCALRPESFSLPSTSKVPTTILTTPSPRSKKALPYLSISLIRQLTNPTTGAPEYLYKIFSPASLSDTFLNSILDPSSDTHVTWIHRKLWHSYPYLPPRVTFEDIQLDREGKVWYTSGVESFISTMETSSLMGMDVASLVVDGWEGKGLGGGRGKGWEGKGWEGKGKGFGDEGGGVREDKDL